MEGRKRKLFKSKSFEMLTRVYGSKMNLLISFSSTKHDTMRYKCFFTKTLGHKHNFRQNDAFVCLFDKYLTQLF